MITFTQFQLHTSLSARDVTQRLTDFIDTGDDRNPDYTKGYAGEINDDTFTLRQMYDVEHLFYGRSWKHIRTRDFSTGASGFKGYGTIVPDRSGTSLKVRMGLHKSTYISLGLFMLSPLVLSAWLSEGVGADFVVFLGPAFLITLGMMLIICSYYYISIRLSARSMKRDLQALLDGTWEPLQIDPFMSNLSKKKAVADA